MQNLRKAHLGIEISRQQLTINQAHGRTEYRQSSLSVALPSTRSNSLNAPQQVDENRRSD